MCMSRNHSKGRFTLPTEVGMEKEVLMLMEKWGADAIRDSDGTRLSKEIMDMGCEVYSTLCLVREDQEWAKNHMDELPETYLMSLPVNALADWLEIDLIEGYLKDEFEIDLRHDPKQWWEVIDRTTGQVVEAALWSFDAVTGKVIVNNTHKYHAYTVNFLVYIIWDPTSMYNYITNNWSGEHKLPIDPRHPKTRQHMLEALSKWVEENPDTDVVRFTSFFYHFPLIFNDQRKQRYVDWYGYQFGISPLAMEEFEVCKGYKLRTEDFVDQGYYNTPGRVPSKAFLDWMEFQHRFVVDLAKECVELVHKAGKKAMMFIGDHWSGAEPYGSYFKEMNLDAVVGSSHGGAVLRMCADVAGVKTREIRFLPYFFPDVFCPGGDPVKEGRDIWIKARRAILRKSVDRIGYGGYLRLAIQFPEFLDFVEGVCNEFREIHEKACSSAPYTPSFKVAVLSSWGKLRSWQVHHGDLLECLSGMAVEVVFISFDDIRHGGIPEDIGVIINAGSADTSWSGGENWKDEKIVSILREWVFKGGGFIGIDEPTACRHQGRYFQLCDILGVEKEIGYTQHLAKNVSPVAKGHFILEDQLKPVNFGHAYGNVYSTGLQTQVLEMINGNPALTANRFGEGRAVYFMELPFSLENIRLLHRTIFWTAGKEIEFKKWFSSNYHTECAAYIETRKMAVINNDGESQQTVVYKGDGSIIELELKPFEIKWLEI